MRVRLDRHGLYIRGRWYGLLGNGEPEYRPGRFPAYSHAYDTTDGGLKEGDNPKTHHLAGVPLIKITKADGTVLHWGAHGRVEGDFPESKV